jgi:hypothetical protein
VKILAVSDLHDDETALEKTIARAKGYDYLLVAGDIGRGRSFLEDLLDAHPKIFLIPGNGDQDFFEEVCGGKCIQEKRVEIEEGLNLVGFGYSPPTPFHTPGEYPDKQLYSWMKGLPIDGKTIFLTHAPPFGILDDVLGVHAGSRAVLKTIEEKKPLVNACGHIHDKEGVAVVGPTSVLKVGAARNGRAGEIDIFNGEVRLRNIGL